MIVSRWNCSANVATVRYSQAMQNFLGVFREGNHHVLSFSILTLENLLQRYSLRVTESHTCFNQAAWNWKRIMELAIGVPVFKLVPKFGGTLLVCAMRA